ncbi:MAG: putative ABC transporter permease [Clostridiales bacterium]|nr:putative ABC transporter permease [Clostridiales bacterium]
MILPYPLDNSLVMFFIYSFIGWVIEVIYYGITEGKFINRGFLNGPLCPVYGLAFYAALAFFEPLKDQPPVIFFGGALACTIVELIAGIILFHMFHLRWWDYTEYKLNFHGYICLRFYFYWGIACSGGVYILHPAVLKLISYIPQVPKYIFLGFALLFMLIDIISTVSSIFKFNKKLRMFHSVASEFKVISDKIGGQIYGTVDSIVTTNQPAVEGYSNYRKLVAAHKAEEEALALKHKEEERQYIDRFLSDEKAIYISAGKAAGDKMLNIVKGFRHADKRLLQVLDVESFHDVNSDTIRVIRDKYFKSTRFNPPTKMVVEENEELDIELPLRKD